MSEENPATLHLSPKEHLNSTSTSQENGSSTSSDESALLFHSALKPVDDLARLLHQNRAALSFAYREPATGRTPLHAAAAAGAAEQVRWLLAHGAPWNQVDDDDFTPAEVALHNGHQGVHDVIYEAAVEQEWKRFNEPASQVNGEGRPRNKWLIDVEASNNDFLKGRVNYVDPRPHIPSGQYIDNFAMVAESGAGVMMEWARPIMQESARLLFEGMRPGASCLNIGFGMGVADTYFQSYAPAHHTIIEAHPDALAYMRKTGWYDKPGVRVLEGRWQDFIGPGSSDFIASNSEGIGRFDVVYFDTFEEGYRAHMEFWKCVPGLLRAPESARFGFFHCHARNNPFAFQVYCEVTRKHLQDLGLETVWNDVTIDPKTVWFSYDDAQNREAGKHLRGEKFPWRIPVSTLKAPAAGSESLSGTG